MRCDRVPLEEWQAKHPYFICPCQVWLCSCMEALPQDVYTCTIHILLALPMARHLQNFIPIHGPSSTEPPYTRRNFFMTETQKPSLHWNFVGKLTETMVTFLILSTVWTAWDILLSVTFPEPAVTSTGQLVPGWPGNLSPDDKSSVGQFELVKVAHKKAYIQPTGTRSCFTAAGAPCVSFALCGACGKFPELLLFLLVASRQMLLLIVEFWCYECIIPRW